MPKETDAFTNKDLGGGSLVELASFTAVSDMLLIVDVRFDQLDGGGDDYYVRITRTPSGGAEIEYPQTTVAVAEASVGRYVVSEVLFVESGDTVKVKAKNASDSGDAAAAGEVLWIDAAPAHYDVDTTGTPLTAAKALEAAVAILSGKASWNASAGVWTIKGRDGSTTLVELTLTGSGNRTAVTIN